MRWRGPFVGGVPHAERSLAHFLYNAGKRSVAVPTDASDARKIGERLLDWADIVLGPLNKDEFARALLDPESIRQQHPHLGVVDVVFRRGHHDAQGTDLTGAAAGGLLWLNGFPDDAPNYPAGHLAYKQVSLVSAFSAIALHVAKSRGHNARWLTVSMQEAVVTTTIQSGNENAWNWDHRSPGRTGGSLGGGQSIFRAADREWVSFVVPPPYWTAYAAWIAEVLGDATFLEPIWADPAYRRDRPEIISSATRKLCELKTRSGLVEEGQRRHLLVCPVNRVGDLANDPHLLAREFFNDVPEPGLNDSVTLPASPFDRSGAGRQLPPAPVLDQHTDEVLGEEPRSTASPRSNRLTGQSSLPLSGIRVLDFCWLIAGPLGTRLLADLGAEVIKVESVARLDRIREGTIVPPSGVTVNTAPVFNDCNTNKKSIALNLGTPEGIDVAKRLVACADVVTSNFTAHRMDRWGLGYEQLKAIKSDIVVASMPVMGRDGPHNFWGAYGNGIIAMSGISALTGFEERPPVGLGTLHSDFTAPYFLAMQVLAALQMRQETGEGQFIEIAQYETAINLLDTELVDYLNNGTAAGRNGNRSRLHCPHGVFPTAGVDEWVAIDVVDDSSWRSLCDAIGRADLRERGDLATVDRRYSHEDELEQSIAQWTRARSRLEVFRILTAAGVAAHPVQRIQDLVETDEAMRGFFVPLDHPDCGTILTQNQPVTWDGQRLPLRRAPLFGEHTHEVLGELLGIGDEEFAGLASCGALS